MTLPALTRALLLAALAALSPAVAIAQQADDGSFDYQTTLDDIRRDIADLQRQIGSGRQVLTEADIFINAINKAGGLLANGDHRCADLEATVESTPAESRWRFKSALANCRTALAPLQHRFSFMRDKMTEIQTKVAEIKALLNGLQQSAETQGATLDKIEAMKNLESSLKGYNQAVRNGQF